jgi:septal ring factor EnvC (AmiA/AmiB activator)
MSTEPTPRRGRPATGTAMSPAEKQKAYRDRLKAKGIKPTRARPATSPDLAELEQLRAYLANYQRMVDEMACRLDERDAEIRRQRQEIESLESRLRAANNTIERLDQQLEAKGRRKPRL